ncbi:hypothetical protein C8T65DRAFT_588170 [Cerioporus squamosus]|nr:hypothetical protein C8T65DRAFT_588170 [Cerioporus squamosus]
MPDVVRDTFDSATPTPPHPPLTQPQQRSSPDEGNEVPNGGFPTVHRDDPESFLQGMAREWTREIWSDPPNSDVLVEVYNYHYSEEDSHNRRIADGLHRHLEQISGESDFDVVPPELEEGLRARTRDLPSVWAIRGLTQRGVARATARGAWSFPSLSFLVFPRAAVIPSWLFMLEGFLSNDEFKIRAAILRVLSEEEMAAWLERMVSSNPEFARWPLERAIRVIVRSLRVETLQLSNGNYVTNIFMRSPTRDVREWRRWVTELRTRRYRSFAIGTGRVRHITACAGCRGVSHPTHLCPFPRVRGWNGPGPGEGVFGERRRGNDSGRGNNGSRGRGSRGLPSQNARYRSGEPRSRNPGEGGSTRTPGRGGRNDYGPHSGRGPSNGRGGGAGGSSNGAGKRHRF